MYDPLALDRLRIDESGIRRRAEAAARQGRTPAGVREARSHRSPDPSARRARLRPLLGR